MELKGRLQEFCGQSQLLVFAMRHTEELAAEVHRSETVAWLK